MFQNLERIEAHGLGDLCNDGMPTCDVTLFKSLNSRKALDHHYKTRGMGDLINSTSQRSLITTCGNDKTSGIHPISSSLDDDTQGTQCSQKVAINNYSTNFKLINQTCVLHITKK